VVDHYTALLRARPPRVYTDEEARIVRQDLERSVTQFHGWLAASNLDPALASDAIERGGVIFQLLALFDDLGYSQGDDRFLWISFVVALRFDPSGAEVDGLTYHFTKAFMKVGRLADENGRIEMDWERIDRELLKNFPAVAARLALDGHRAVHYAPQWTTIWFADHYELEQILILWDNIIAEIGKDETQLKRYLRCLVIAHVQQCPLPVNEQLMLEVIRYRKEWNLPQILRSAEKLMNPKSISKWVVFGGLLTVLAGWFVGEK
jgi:hypothetical protein